MSDSSYLTGGPISGQLNTPGTVAPASPLAVTDAGTTLYNELSRKHPDYLAWEDRWRVYRDVVDDAEFRKELYLHQNEREHDEQYAFRVKIAEFLPDTPSYIERILGALYNQKPKRTLGMHPELVKFSESVERARRSALSSMDSFMERVMRTLISFGSMRVLVTTQKSSLSATRAEEKAAGDRPYLVLYTPLSVIDWDEDDFGELVMVRICERFTRKLDPEDPASPHVQFTRYIQYDREKAEWWTFRADPESQDKYLLVDNETAEHGMGIVPMVVHYWPDIFKTMVGKSFIRYMARAEVSRFRSDSDLDYDTHMHAHPALCLRTNAKTPGDVIIGGGRYIKLKLGDKTQGAEEAFYLEYPTPAFDALTATIEAKKNAVRKYAAVDPSGVLEEELAQPMATSGVARAWSFGTSEARTLSSLADAAAEIEANIFELVLRAYGHTPTATGENVFKGEVQYPEEFEVTAASILLEEAEKAGMNINSPTFIRYLHKRYVRARAGDAGQDTLEKIDKEIEKNPVMALAVRPPDADVLGFPGGGSTTQIADEDSASGDSEIDTRPTPKAARANRLAAATRRAHA